eukprot:6493217-Pyramimonas_sp.AAC.2
MDCLGGGVHPLSRPSCARPRGGDPRVERAAHQFQEVLVLQGAAPAAPVRRGLLRRREGSHDEEEG